LVDDQAIRARRGSVRAIETKGRKESEGGKNRSCEGGRNLGVLFLPEKVLIKNPELVDQ